MLKKTVWKVGFSGFSGLFFTALLLVLLQVGTVRADTILTPGDVAIIGYITNGTPDSFSFVNFVTLDAGTVIYFTDNGWTGSAFRGSSVTDGDGNENLIKFTVVNPIPPGTVITSGGSSADFSWTTSGSIPGTSSGSFANLALSNGSGEQIAAFQSGTNNPMFSGYTATYQIDNTGTFEDATNTNQGNVIPGLSQGANTALLFNNISPSYAAFNLTTTLTSTTKADWLAAINNASNWTFGSLTNLPSGTIIVGSASANLKISLSDSPDPVVVNNPLTYTLMVTNSGSLTATGITVTFNLPSSGYTFGGATGFTPVQGGNIVTFTNGSLNPGASATLTVQVTPTVTGTLTSGVALVDPTNSISESNEADNSTTAMTTQVNAAPAGFAPTIVLDISTHDRLDGGAVVSATSPFTVSGVINDPTDPAKIYGLNFTLADADTAVASLMVSASSSTSTVVSNANLNVTGSGANRTLTITPTGVGYTNITIAVDDGSNTTNYILKYAASAASTTPTTSHFHTGTSDASTAIALDSNYMLMADDDDQILRLYERNNSGLSLNGFDFTSSLALTQTSGGVPREVDIEAATKVGSTIYWLGSQSNSSSGSNRPNRYRLFATSLSGSGASSTLSYVSHYSNLRTDLLTWGDGHGYNLTASAATGIIPEAATLDGFNIEGFTIAPNGTAAYIGFRAPQVPVASRTKALIAPITNFTTWASGNFVGSPTLGSPIELDLGGRGIRSLECNSNGCLIVAGPADSATGIAPKDFRLYTWTGNSVDAPVLRTANLTTLNTDGSFESIVELPTLLTDTSSIQLLADNGDTVWYADGTIAKDLSESNFIKFRSDIVTLGAAVVPDLFFSEYIEGSSNNKAFEIYNPTGANVDLGAGVYSVQLHSNGAPITSPTSSLNLTGVLTAGEVYVIANSSANAAILAIADITSGVANYNGDDALVLKKNGVIIDVIGQVGFDPGTEWIGSGVSTVNQTLQRKITVTSGDSNGSDAFNPSVEWDSYVQDNVVGLGCHPARPCPVPPQLSSYRPSNGATNVATTTSTIVITFTENVTVTAGGIGLSCGTLTGLPVSNVSSVTLTLGSSLPDSTNCIVTLTATQITDSDGYSLTGTSSFSFTTMSPPGATILIHTIQGNGLTSPLSGTTNVSIEGIVVGDFQGSTYLNGFYVQEEDAEADGNAATSEGILVYDAAFGVDVNVGDMVKVTGDVVEYTSSSNGVTSQLTELSNISAVTVLSSGNPLPTAATVSLPVTSVNNWEAYEGMRVNVSGTLYVSDNYTLGQYGQVTLASSVLEQFTHANAPSVSGYAAHLATIAKKSLILDDGRTGQNPDPVIHSRGGTGLSASNTLRQGDSVTGLSGILDQRFEGYRIQTTTGANFTASNARLATPPAVGGTLRVASANVLNYFNTFTNCALGVGGATSTSNCRGAENAAEFTRQRDKTVKVFQGLNADIVGIMEMENDGYGSGSALQDLVNGINTIMGAGTYSFIDADALLGATNVAGTDAIKVALIYKTGVVTPVAGTTAAGTDAIFDRKPIAQTFMTSNGEKLTVIVNHLKSKGSCPGSGSDSDQLDGQGCWNPKRVQQATALINFVNTLTVNDPDVLLLGDFNAYAMEDPITTIKNGGFTDLINAYHGTSGYSYVFDGMIGYLDQGIASTSLVPQVTGATDWHVNADEPIALDYNTNFKSTGQITSFYAADAYRASDHDPVLIGLTLVTTPSLVVSAISGNTTEAGGTASFTVKLGSAPVSTVTIPITTSDLSEGSVTSTTLTFNNSNWNTPQTVIVTGVDDVLVDGSVAYNIIVGLATSSDSNYNGLGPVQVAVINADNDTPLNSSPQAKSNVYVMSENTVLTMTAPGVLGNDSDPENNPLTAILATTTTSGTLTLNNDGSFIYTPRVGFIGTDYFIYIASDGTSNSNAATVNITVQAIPLPTVTITPTVTATATITSTPTITTTATVTPTPSVTVTGTPTSPVTSTPSVTVTATPTVTMTPTPSVTVTTTPPMTTTPTITVTETPTVTVTPTGTVVTPTPTATPQPKLVVSYQGQPVSQTVEFSKTWVGRPITRTLSLSNAGLSNLVITNIIVPAGFRLMTPTTFNVTLPAFTAQPLLLQLVAQQAGHLSGTVEIYSNDPTQPIFTFPVMGKVKPVVTCLQIIIIPPTRLLPGQLLAFQIKVVNDCDYRLRLVNVVIVVSVPQGRLTYQASADPHGWQPTQPAPRQRSNTLNYSLTLAELSANQTTELAFPVIVGADVADGTALTTALSVNGEGVTLDSQEEVEGVAHADLTLTVTRPKLYLPLITR